MASFKMSSCLYKINYGFRKSSFCGGLILGVLWSSFGFSQEGKSKDLSSPNDKNSTSVSATSEASREQDEGEVKMLPAEVFHCHDGDTCRLKVAGGLWMNVRLAGIDAPEVSKTRGGKQGQIYGTESREFLNTLLKGKKGVQVRQVDLDPFNRPVVEIFEGGRNINVHLLEEGFAEAYRGKVKRLDKSLYFGAEEKAKKAKKGIWSLAKYQSPKEFRQQQKD